MIIALCRVVRSCLGGRGPTGQLVPCCDGGLSPEYTPLSLDCRSGKYSLNICSKSGKLSAEVGIQSGKLDLKMLPIRTDYVDGQIGLPIPLSCCKQGCGAVTFLVGSGSGSGSWEAFRLRLRAKCTGSGGSGSDAQVLV